MQTLCGVVFCTYLSRYPLLLAGICCSEVHVPTNMSQENPLVRSCECCEPNIFFSVQSFAC
jgi:hypothetical protein